MCPAQPSGVTRDRGFAGALHQWSHPGPPDPLRTVSPFSTRATRSPCLAAPMAAQHPAIPPPITSTSVSTTRSSPKRMG